MYVVLTLFSCVMILIITGGKTVGISAQTLLMLPATGVLLVHLYHREHKEVIKKLHQLLVVLIILIEETQQVVHLTPRLTDQGSDNFMTKLKIRIRVRGTACQVQVMVIVYSGGITDTSMASHHKEESGPQIGLTPMKLEKEHKSMLDDSQQRIVVYSIDVNYINIIRRDCTLRIIFHHMVDK